MRVINAEIGANYNDVSRRLPRRDSVEISYFVDDVSGKEWVVFNVFVSEREDDYITMSVELEELLSSIAKEIKEERKE
jgi:hypothetical protein